MRYESFSIRIEPSPDGAFAVSVQSPQGEGQGNFSAPRTGGLSCPGSRPKPIEAGESRDLASPPPLTRRASALDAGKELFRALFRDEVAGLFHASLGSLQRRGYGLRINISFDPRRSESAPLHKLPWELLCRPETEDYLCLSRQTPVIRSLEAHRERQSAPARPRRLRILAVAASPANHPLIDVERERVNLKEAWKGQEKNIEIVFLDRGGVEEIRQVLLKADFHVLHFMGHGMFDGENGEGLLLFEHRDGTGQPFEGRRLAQLIHDFDSLRLVVLNACHTAESVGTHGPNPFAGVASALVMGGVPAVVAMRGPVPDIAAVAFSRTFYQRLAAGDPIEAAVTEGRLAIQRAVAGNDAWATPTLFLRSPDGMLFAPRSTVWARRAALLAAGFTAVALIFFLALVLVRECRMAEARRLTNEGIGLLKLGRTEEAREAFRSALDIEPDNAVALGNLAVVEIQLGDDEAALVHAQAAVKAAPTEALLHYNLGNLLALRKRYEEALVSLQKAIEIDPNYAYAFNELGNVYLELGHPAEARKVLEAGLSRDRSMAKLHKNLARAALAEGRPEEAVRHLEMAQQLYSPADPAGKIEAAYWLAAAQAASGRSTAACEALQTFKVLDPHLLSPFATDATFLAKQNRCAPWA